MKYKTISSMLLVISIISMIGFASIGESNVVDVRIVSDKGIEFPRYRTYPGVRRPGAYFYMEALKGEKYSIEVRNRSDRRIGVVIAVDGRNIISGGKSDLKNNERMYIIEPYATNIFEGWRTGMNRTNRFYFTEQSNSYAEKVFSDASAMGTIALAVYREKLPVIAPLTPSYNSESKSQAPRGKQGSGQFEGESRDEQSGTGFGETTYSPSREVLFEPENIAAGRVVLKYEWRTELCKKGIIACGPKNRFWPDGWGFAPIPGDFRE